MILVGLNFTVLFGIRKLQNCNVNKDIGKTALIAQASRAKNADSYLPTRKVRCGCC